MGALEEVENLLQQSAVLCNSGDSAGMLQTLLKVAEIATVKLPSTTRLQIARALVPFKCWPQIEQIYRSVETDDPAFEEALEMRYTVLAESGKFEVILEEGTQILTKPEFDWESLRPICSILWRYQQFGYVEQLLINADQRADPEHWPSAFQHLLSLHFDNGNVERAVDLFVEWFPNGHVIKRAQVLLELAMETGDYLKIFDLAEGKLSLEHGLAFYEAICYISHLIGFDKIPRLSAERLLNKRLELARKLGIDTLAMEVLTDDQLNGIVAIPSIDLLVRMRELGLIKSRLVLLVNPEKFVNLSLLPQYQQYATIITDPKLRQGLKDLLGKALTRTCPFIRADDGRVYRDEQWWALINEDWKIKNRGPLIKLNVDHLEEGRRFLSEASGTEVKWFVTVHMRGSADAPMSPRDVDVQTYTEAFKRIVAAGGSVVRIGDPSMVRLENLPGVIDYAHLPQKSERLDMFLLSQCRFFIGVNSGPTSVVRVFDRPAVLTNHIPICLASPMSSDIYLLKLLWKAEEQRLLTFREMLSSRAGHTVYEAVYDKLGITLRNNTPEEIFEAVDEMINGGPAETALDRELAARLKALYKEFEVHSNARMGRLFLRRFQDLL